MFVFFFKQKTAYEMRISDWSSDVCSSDLVYAQRKQRRLLCNARSQFGAADLCEPVGAYGSKGVPQLGGDFFMMLGKQGGQIGFNLIDYGGDVAGTNQIGRAHV